MRRPPAGLEICKEQAALNCPVVLPRMNRSLETSGMRRGIDTLALARNRGGFGQRILLQRCGLQAHHAEQAERQHDDCHPDSITQKPVSCSLGALDATNEPMKVKPFCCGMRSPRVYVA